MNKAPTAGRESFVTIEELFELAEFERAQKIEPSPGYLNLFEVPYPRKVMEPRELENYLDSFVQYEVLAASRTARGLFIRAAVTVLFSYTCRSTRTPKGLLGVVLRLTFAFIGVAEQT